jgi:hypothetical protein
MTEIRLPRIEALLASDLTTLDETDLATLVSGQVAEDADLDFKRELYGTTDSDRRSLAGDLAALANTSGGLIVLGLDEVNGIASVLTPQPLSEAEDLRMRQVIAGLVAPVPRFEISRVPSAADPSSGYYLLVVDRSLDAPHAVRVNDALRYPKRIGASTRYLTEAEVADAYRNRFDGAEALANRATQLLAEGRTHLDLEDRVWLATWIVPTQPGSLNIRMETLDQFRTFGGAHFIRRRNGVGVFHSGAGLDVSTGMRRMTITTGFDPDRLLATGAYSELHTDGAGFAGCMMWGKRNAATPHPQVDDGLMATTLLGQMQLLVSHAVDNCRAGGDAVVCSTLLGPESGDEVDTGLFLVQWRGGFVDALGSRPVFETPVSRHSFSLDAAYNSGPEIVSIASMLMSDLVQTFGLAESLQLTPVGVIRRQYLDQDARRDVEAWANARDVEVTDETV